MLISGHPWNRAVHGFSHWFIQFPQTTPTNTYHWINRDNDEVMLNKEKRPKSEYACDGGAVIEPEKVTLFKDNRRNKVTCAANIEVYFELTRHPIMYYNRRPVYSDRIAERYLVWNKTKWVIVDT